MRLPKPWKRKSNGKWYVEWCGKQIDLGTDKKAAHTKYNEMLRENQIGPGAPRIAARQELTMHELIDTYAAWIKDNRAESSYEVKKFLFEALKTAEHEVAGKMVPVIPATLPASAMTPLIVEQFFRTQPKIKSPTTKWDKITVLISMFNWGVRMGALAENPIAGMPKPTPRVRQDFVPEERFNDLFKNIKNKALEDFVTVMLESGARAQEMFDFEAEHYDDKLKAFVLTIEDSKGNKRSRVVYLTPRADAIVQRLIAQYPQGKLFRNTRGNPWTKDSINCQMRRLKTKLGMPGMCATVLRHSYAHWRLTQGQDGLTVSKFMGHVDTRMLSKRYGHLEGSTFLAKKAAELTMPLPDGNANAAQDQSGGSEPTGPGGPVAA
jgi:integrase